MNLLELQRRMAEDVRRPLTADYEMQRMADDGTPTADIAASYMSPNTGSRHSNVWRSTIGSTGSA